MRDRVQSRRRSYLEFLGAPEIVVAQPLRAAWSLEAVRQGNSDIAGSVAAVPLSPLRLAFHYAHRLNLLLLATVH